MRPPRHTAVPVTHPSSTFGTTSMLNRESKSRFTRVLGPHVGPHCGLGVGLVLAVTVAVAAAQPSSAFAAPCWQPPAVGEIVDHYRAPDCPYCAGNRGIEVATNGAVPVRAVEAGLVTFSGNVAGTVYVVVEHANGWKVTYGRLGSSGVDRGQRVARGARLGTSSGDLYFGVRVDGAYRDPEPFLGRLTGRPRLIPLDGTARRSAPASTWTCSD